MGKDELTRPALVHTHLARHSGPTPVPVPSSGAFEQDYSELLSPMAHCIQGCLHGSQGKILPVGFWSQEAALKLIGNAPLLCHLDSGFFNPLQNQFLWLGLRVRGIESQT